MGIAGFKTVRYRGRYYRYYNRFDGSLEGLGKVIVSEIPADPEAYAKWLADQRDSYEVLRKQLGEYLSVKRYDVGQEPSENGRSITRPEFISHGYENLPSGMLEHINHDDGLREYIVDLDREVFTINNSAHMKLNCIPKHDWIQALVNAFPFDHAFIILPGMVPNGCVTDLVLKIGPTPAEAFNIYNSLSVKIVNAKGIKDIPSSQHHGPLLSAGIFRMFQGTQRKVLEDFLLGWSADDLCFREIVHAILCFASPSKNLSLVRSRRVLDSPLAGYSDILSRAHPERVRPRLYDTSDSESESDDSVEQNRGEHTKETNQLADTDAEFVAHFGVGCHLQGNPPGSSATESIYWFEGVLVVLAVQLTRTGTVAENVTRVFQYHQQNCARMTINAVIISIEHVILLSIDSHGKIQHTEPLCIWTLDTRRPKEPLERFPAAYLGALENWVHNASARKAMKRRHAAEMIEAVKKREEKQTCGKATPSSLKGNVDAIYRPEQDLERIHAEERARYPNKGEIDLTYEKEIGKYRGIRVLDRVTKSSFLSLVYFLEAAARQRTCTTQGRLPTEIYRMIIESLPDTETFRTCMDVSTIFRDLCQQQLWVMDNFVVLTNGTPSKNHACKLNEGQIGTPIINTYHLPTGIIQGSLVPKALYKLLPTSCFSDREEFKVVLGSQRDRRTILHDMDVSWAHSASIMRMGDSDGNDSE